MVFIIGKYMGFVKKNQIIGFPVKEAGKIPSGLDYLSITVLLWSRLVMEVVVSREENEVIMYKYIFGPVPSRRLGISLGVDLVTPKSCNLNCIYCESGKTTDHRNERRSFFNKEELFKELQEFLRENDKLDYITFSGAGEPLLNSDLGEIISFIKSVSDTPVALITNGILLGDEKVREEVADVDLVLPSLDCVLEESFKSLNNPCASVSVLDHVEGLKKFASDFKGDIWLEVFFAEGVNDSENEIRGLKEVIEDIAPAKVQLNTLDRPAAFSGVRAVSREFLDNLAVQWESLGAEVVKKAKSRSEISGFSKNLEKSIINTVARRPLTLDDLAVLTGASEGELGKYLDVLEKEKKTGKKIVDGNIFYILAESGENV